ncbi:MAG: hypothetical protein JXA41_06265 [Deltaproteobacteria bacterium]|nr:hypothetical protein [Deltaproteobacteria bacterium]
MLTKRFGWFFLSFLFIAATGTAATFEKVSVSYSVARQGILQCPLANNPPELSWTFRETMDGFDTEYTFWSHTPILRKDAGLLVSLDSVENVGSGMFDDQPGGEAYAMEAGGGIYNRVNAYAYQRPVFEVWRPAYGSSYTLNMSVGTDTEAYYKIQATNGENEGDEVTLRVGGYVEATHSASGPEGTAIVQVIGPGGVSGFNNIAYTPGYVNQSDGVWHNISGTRYFTAHIGDVIGMRASVFSSIGPVASAPIKNWILDHYRPRSLYASSWLDASIVAKPLPGDLDGNEAVDMGDAVLVLQILSGQVPDQLRFEYVEAGVDINGDNQAGLAELLYIMQTTSGLRQN